MAGQLVPGALRELSKLQRNPGLRRMQKSCRVAQGHLYNVPEARINGGIAVCCTHSGARLSGYWLPLLLVMGQGWLPMGLGASAPCCTPRAGVSVILTYSKRKKWHVNASVKIVKPAGGNGLDCRVGDRPGLLGIVSTGKQCFFHFFSFRKQRPVNWFGSQCHSHVIFSIGKNKEYCAVWI